MKQLEKISVNPDVTQSIIDTTRLMTEEKLVAFGAPDDTHRFRVDLTEPDKDGAAKYIQPEGFFSGFRAHLSTDGDLILVNYIELWGGQHAGLDRHDTIMKVPKGRYLVQIFRFFPWVEGEQYADLNTGINYQLSLTQVYDERSPFIKFLTIPWVGWDIVVREGVSQLFK